MKKKSNEKDGFQRDKRGTDHRAEARRNKERATKVKQMKHVKSGKGKKKPAKSEVSDRESLQKRREDSRNEWGTGIGSRIDEKDGVVSRCDGVFSEVSGEKLLQDSSRKGGVEEVWEKWQQEEDEVLIGCLGEPQEYFLLPEQMPEFLRMKNSVLSTHRSPVHSNRSLRKRASSDPAILLEISSMRERRQRVISEIIETECYYVGKLLLVMELFKVPLEKQVKSSGGKAVLMPLSDIITVFGNLEVILRYNEVLLAQLREQEHQSGLSGSTGKTALGDIFLKLSDFLKTYVAYVNRWPESQRLIEDARRHSKQFRLFVQEAEKDPRCEGNRILSLLFFPVQRIPRYVLLLKELVKHTHQADGDMPSLKKALEKMSRVAEEIDAGQRNADNAARMIAVQSRLNLPALMSVPSRRYVMEGSLYHLPAKGGKDRVDVILFNDIMLMAKGHKLLTYVDLSLSQLSYYSFAENRSSSKQSTKEDDLRSWCFTIIAPDCTAYSIAATTPQETESWVKSVQDCRKDADMKEDSFLRQHRMKMFS